MSAFLVTGFTSSKMCHSKLVKLFVRTQKSSPVAFLEYSSAQLGIFRGGGGEEREPDFIKFIYISVENTIKRNYKIS